MTANNCYFFSLPNELILHILTLIPTPELLPLTTVSHRITSIILRVLHTRLQYAASLHGHTLLLECYHPSAKLTEPPLYCNYLGTPGLDDSIDCWRVADATQPDVTRSLGTQLGTLKGMYSRFRPHRKDRQPTRRHPAGDVPGSRTHPSTPALPSQKHGDGDEELVRQLLTLDSHELFTQLCSVTNLVKVGPRNGLFRSFVEIEDDFLRVWRKWLEEMAANHPSQPVITTYEMNNSDGKGKARADLAVKDIQEDNSILWVTRSKNVGIRFRVRERKLRRDTPVFVYANEEVAVSYDIEYEELLIRTSHLLLALEKSFIQQESYSSKAIVFGSFG